MNSQKIRKYLSSPKEAPKIAEAAFLGAFVIYYRCYASPFSSRLHRTVTRI